MLAIKKRSRAFKAISAGSLAFAVGLTGVAAYVTSSLEHQNLVFGKEQTVSKSSDDTTAGGEVILGAQHEANVQGAAPATDDMQQFAPPATVSPAANAPQPASVSVAAATSSKTDVAVTPAEPVGEPSAAVTEEPAAPAPGGVDVDLGLCVEVLGIPVNVNCRPN